MFNGGHMTTKPMKIAPATPLPYAPQDVSSQYFLTGLDHDGLTQLRVAEFILRADRAYIAHAANAYPKLVEALRDAIARHADLLRRVDGELAQSFKDAGERRRALLRELGEDA